MSDVPEISINKTDEFELKEYAYATSDSLIRTPSELTSSTLAEEMERERANASILESPGVQFRLKKMDSGENWTVETANRKSFNAKRASQLRTSILRIDNEEVVASAEATSELKVVSPEPSKNSFKFPAGTKPLPSGQVLAKIDAHSFQVLQLTSAPLDEANRFLLLSVDNSAVS